MEERGGSGYPDHLGSLAQGGDPENAYTSGLLWLELNRLLLDAQAGCGSMVTSQTATNVTSPSPNLTTGRTQL